MTIPFLLAKPKPAKYAKGTEMTMAHGQPVTRTSSPLTVYAPHLLKTIVELTGGDSLESNIKLVLNNAAVGSEVAKEYAKIK